jgi:hypothetical protein
MMRLLLEFLYSTLKGKGSKRRKQRDAEIRKSKEMKRARVVRWKKIPD